jgi:hypothetical protein
MKADTHTLLLDAALFGSPTLTCRGPHGESAAPPSDQSTAANWERASALTDGDEARKPAWAGE